jgi:[ribosomal protein S5]-alanine N-acetyltransferase
MITTHGMPDGRFKSQHKYDAGQIDLDRCDLQWFLKLCQHHQKLALSDKVYIFGVFSRETNQHLGNIDMDNVILLKFLVMAVI